MVAMVPTDRKTGITSRSASILGTGSLCILMLATFLHGAINSEVIIIEDDIASLLTRASAGDGRAQLELAHRLDAQSTKDPDLESQALMWYRAAAHSGLIEAQRSFGERLITRPKTESDLETGIRWLRTASANDDPVALYRLGIAHRTGEGVRRNEVRAFQLFRAAADLGHIPALIELALHYEFAMGTAFSIEDAIHWYRQAAQSGSTAAELRLAEIYASGRGVSRNLETALNWCRPAVEAGNARALFLDGLIRFRMGDSGLNRIVESANREYAPAQSFLGFHMLASSDHPSDRLKAQAWLRRAADQGDVPGMIGLGQIARFGLVDPGSLEQGAAWLSKALTAAPEFSSDARELVEAIRIGNTDRRDTLLHAGVSPNARDADGIPALLVAVTNSDSDSCRRLLERGADPNHCVTGLRSLFVAADRGDTENVQLLIRFGADVNADWFGWKPLDLAGTPEVTDLIAAAGGTRSNRSRLHQAAAAGDTNQLRLLMEDGVSPDAQLGHRYPVTSAAIEGQDEIIELLLGAGATPELGGPMSPLYQSAFSGEFERFDRLLAASSDINGDLTQSRLASYKNGRVDQITAIHFVPLIAATRAGNAPMVTRLLEKGAHPDRKDALDRTALMWAVLLRRSDLVRLLLLAGASTEPLDRWHRSVFDLAHSSASPALAELSDPSGVFSAVGARKRWLRDSIPSPKGYVAEMSFREGQLRLGGQSPDPVRALEAFKEAASYGHPDAVAAMGLMLESGSVGQVDLPGALVHFREAARLGSPQAHLALARFHWEGMAGLPPDPGRSLAHLKSAAYLGNREAQFELALRLHRGEGSPPDPIGSMAWAVQTVDDSHGFDDRVVALARDLSIDQLETARIRAAIIDRELKISQSDPRNPEAEPRRHTSVLSQK